MARKARFHPILFKERIVSDYLTGDYSYRELAATYDVNFQLIQRWVQKFTVAELNTMKPSESKEKKGSVEPSAEVKRLQEELQRAKLHNKLLESLLDIGREKYGIDLRKKNGTKQS